MPIPEDLLEILRCVACGGTVTDSGATLTCNECSAEYPIEDGVPVMLPDAVVGPNES